MNWETYWSIHGTWIGSITTGEDEICVATRIWHKQKRFHKTMHGSRWSPQPKMFLSFFATRCLIKPSPIQSSRPNWKIDQFLAWIKYISKKACKIGKIISVDEQTCGFKGWNASKLRITYNKEGNGFQCNALCDDGYTFTFYFRHDPPPEKYNAIGISPIHARVM